MNQNNVPAESKKELFESLEKLKNEINAFRKDLNKINDEKESWFDKKKEIYSTIREKIASIKENKKKRDNLTSNVKSLKEKRNEFNQEISKNVSELLKLKEEMKNLTKKSKIKDPYRLKGEIDALEVKLETEVTSFEKEKELSKKLKLLKKMFRESTSLLNILDKINKLNSEINTSKKNTYELHNEIQKLAHESQKLHEGIITDSKEIDGLSAQEDDALKHFVTLKKDFNDTSNKLKEKLSEMSALMEKVNKFKLEEDEKRKLKDATFIKSKEQEVEEKIKARKKLTTEDFLVFQEAIKNKKEI